MKAAEFFKTSPMFDSVEIVCASIPQATVFVHMDLDEGRWALFSCLACHEMAARLSVAIPFRFYVASLDCEQCGAQLIEFDALTGELQ